MNETNLQACFFYNTVHIDYTNTVLMIITENCLDIHYLCLAKFNLARQMLNLAGKCLVTGHHHNPC